MSSMASTTQHTRPFSWTAREKPNQWSLQSPCFQSRVGSSPSRRPPRPRHCRPSLQRRWVPCFSLRPRPHPTSNRRTAVMLPLFFHTITPPHPRARSWQRLRLGMLLASRLLCLPTDQRRRGMMRYVEWRGRATFKWQSMDLWQSPPFLLPSL